jgi:hypothetical protein
LGELKYCRTKGVYRMRGAVGSRPYGRGGIERGKLVAPSLAGVGIEKMRKLHRRFFLDKDLDKWYIEKV